jgi:DNA-binding MarR family transcriptional regulator
MAAKRGQANRATLTPAQYQAIAAFRYELRRFLAFSEAAAAKAGLPAQQHQALLAIAGYSGEGRPSVGEIAELLLIAPHSGAELIARMEEAGLVKKSASPRDRRRIELAVTRKAETILHRLTAAHLRELSSLEPALARAIGRLNRTRT